MNLNNEAQKTGVMNKMVLALYRPLFLALFLIAGCSPKSQLSDVSGDVQVKIPLSSRSGDSSQYKIEVVTLKGLSNLKEVAGFFAQFFYAPGMTQNQLTGDSPQSRFIKTNQNIYVPIDQLSQQMATIYFHIQNLAEFSQVVGAGEVNQGPMKIGLETKVGDSEALSKNNAFYDGKSDAMLFVPFTSSQLPIALNSGIIAHEYFHSLFYKMVLKNLEIKDKMAQAKMKQVLQARELYNETYLRGTNEGLADFWGWIYSDDDDFIRWSLSAYSKNRKLSITEKTVGQFESAENIFSKVQTALQTGADASEYLSEYIYKIGTPQARFLKQLTTIAVEEGADGKEAKKTVAQAVLGFLKSTVIKMKALNESEVLPADSLFEFIASTEAKLKLSQKQCELVLSYIQKNEVRINDACQKQADDSYQVKPQTDE